MANLTYAIGDLHGRFDLLLLAVSAAERHAQDSGNERSHFIVLGDFVDRGCASRSIIEFLKDGAPSAGWDWTVLQGNHEAMMLDVLASPTGELLRWWFGNGGGQTLMSYGYKQGDPLMPLKVPRGHLEWLEGLPVYHEDLHRIYVHAGVPFDRTPQEARKDAMQWMLYPGDIEGASMHIHPDEGHCTGKHIVHGHHQSEAHPLCLPHRTNLDSFAWHTGRLVVGVFDDDKAGGPIDLIEVTVDARLSPQSTEGGE